MNTTKRELEIALSDQPKRNSCAHQPATNRRHENNNAPLAGTTARLLITLREHRRSLCVVASILLFALSFPLLRNIEPGVLRSFNFGFGNVGWLGFVAFVPLHLAMRIESEHLATVVILASLFAAFVAHYGWAMLIAAIASSRRRAQRDALLLSLACAAQGCSVREHLVKVGRSWNLRTWE